MPGEVSKTLRELETSFKELSPEGYKRPSDAFQEIPLFYLAFLKHPLHYKFYRKDAGLLRLHHRSVEEILSIAELADSVGVTPEETDNYGGRGGNVLKWETSFGGQCLLLMQELAQYMHCASFIPTETMREAWDDTLHMRYSVFEALASDDHFKLVPTSSDSWQSEYSCRWGYNKCGKASEKGHTPWTQRMVKVEDEQLRSILTQIPKRLLSEWRTQAALLKSLPKRGAIQALAHMHQAASGPALLSVAVLLQFFELRPALLLNADYRAYFWSVLRSGDSLERAVQAEPLLMQRLLRFIEELAEDDVQKLETGKLRLDRLLWCTQLVRHLVRLDADCLPALEALVKQLKDRTWCESDEASVAAHLLCMNQLLGGDWLEPPDIARAHLLVGRNPPTSANDYVLWLELAEAMQAQARRLVELQCYGEPDMRDALWTQLLSSSSEVKELQQRKAAHAALKTLATASATLRRTVMKQGYLGAYQRYFGKYTWRKQGWRVEATTRLQQKACTAFESVDAEVSKEGRALLQRAQQQVLHSDTAVLAQLSGRTVTVDWSTGRVSGAGESLPTGTRLPVHLRRHPELQRLGKVLRLPIQRTGKGTEVSFRSEEPLPVTVDLADGAARLCYEGALFRLHAGQQLEKIGLPDQLAEGFSLWLSEVQDGAYAALIVAHDPEGRPKPCYRVGRDGRIHPMEGNPRLHLAGKASYSEAEVFERWGLPQSALLIWLDDNERVAELHLPLCNSHAHFTRVLRSDDGRWKLDGMDLFLEEIKEAVPAFAGHPVYLVASDAAGKRRLLLPGADPFTVNQRMHKRPMEVDWNSIIATGAREPIHQFRILASGQIEGLNVADNLLLALWKLRMGHYSAVAELGKRWLTPPGRPYTEREQELLLTWMREGFDDNKMDNECHPSALALRLYFIVHMSRHLKEYPPPPPEDKKQCDLWTFLLGKRSESGMVLGNLSETLTIPQSVGRQLRGTRIDELLSSYDIETFFRLVREHREPGATSLGRHLNQRLGHSDQLLEPNRITASLEHFAEEVLHWIDDPKWGNYTFGHLCERYPTTAQNGVVPTRQLGRSVVPTLLAPFFDQAYRLIKEGPQSAQENAEYSSIIQALGDLHGPKQVDLCLQYLSKRCFQLHHHMIYEENLLLWLLLEQAFLAHNQQLEIPDLPTVEHRFGLAVASSKEKSEAFFAALVELSGYPDAGHLLQAHRKAWGNTRNVHYVEQTRDYIAVDDKLTSSVKQKIAPGLDEALEQWQKLSCAIRKAPAQLDVALDGWEPVKLAHLKRVPDCIHQLEELHREVQAELAAFKRREDVAGESLRAEVNRLPRGKHNALCEAACQLHYVAPRSLDECIGAGLMATQEAWKRIAPYSVARDLQHLTLVYLSLALERQQLSRLEQQLQLCLRHPENPDHRRVAQETLLCEHRYLPSSANIVLMASEYYADMRMRNAPDQAKLIQVLTQEPTALSEHHSSKIDKARNTGRVAKLMSYFLAREEEEPSFRYSGTVIQAIMGSGKSKMLGPAALQSMLGRGRMAMLCVPNSLFRTTLSDLQTMMWKRFGTYVQALTFDRDSCDKKRLYTLVERLHLGLQRPTVYVCRPRDLHALQLMLKERHQLVEEMRSRLQRFTLTWAKALLLPGIYGNFRVLIRSGKWEEAKNLLPDQHRVAFGRWQAASSTLETESEPLLKEADMLQGVLNLIQVPDQCSTLVDEAATVYDPRNQLSFPIGWQEQANPRAAAVACRLYFEWLPEHLDTLKLLSNMQEMVDDPRVRKKVYEDVAQSAWKYFTKQGLRLPSLLQFTAYLLNDPIKGIPMMERVFELHKSKSALEREYAQELAFLKYCLSSGLDGCLSMTAHVNHGRSKQDPKLYLSIPYERSNVPKENTLFRRPWKTALATSQLYLQGWKDPQQTLELLAFLRGVDPSSKDSSLLEAAAKVWGREFSDADLEDNKAMQRLTDVIDAARCDDKLQPYALRLISCYLQHCVFPVQLKIDPAQLTSTAQDLANLTDKSDAMGGTFGFEGSWNPHLVRRADHSSDETILRALAEPRNQRCVTLPAGGAEAFLDAIDRGEFRDYMAIQDVGAVFKGIGNRQVAERLLRGLGTVDCILYYDDSEAGKGARLAIMTARGPHILEHADRAGVERALTQLKLKRPFAYYDQNSCVGMDLALPDGRALLTFGKVTKDEILQGATRNRKLVDGRQSIDFGVPEEMGRGWTGDRCIEASKEQQRIVEEKANFHAICEQLRGEIRGMIDRKMRGCADRKERHAIHCRAKEFQLEKQSNDLVEEFGAVQGWLSSDRAIDRLTKRLAKFCEQVTPGSHKEAASRLKHILDWHKERGTVLPKLVREGDEQDDAVQEVDLSKDMDRQRLMEEEYERMLGSRNEKDEVPWKVFDKRWIAATPFGAESGRQGMPTLYLLSSAVAERGFAEPFGQNMLISKNLLSTFLGEANCLLTSNQKPLHHCLLVKGKECSRLVLVTEEEALALRGLLLDLPKEQGRGVYLIQPSGRIDQRGNTDEQISDLWQSGSPQERGLLLQALIFQGSALMLQKLPEGEVKAAMKRFTGGKPRHVGALRALFEASLELRNDDMVAYRRSQTVRSFFA